jgi:peptidoglycan hydrolase CwlO-like protein
LDRSPGRRYGRWLLHGNDLVYTLYSILAIIVILVGWRHRREIAKWIRSSGAAEVAQAANDVINILKEQVAALKDQVTELKTQVAVLQEQVKAKDAQILVLQELTTQRAEVQALKDDLDSHKKLVYENHRAIIERLGAISHELDMKDN